jgi:hypothetical protein
MELYDVMGLCKIGNCTEEDIQRIYEIYCLPIMGKNTIGESIDKTIIESEMTVKEGFITGLILGDGFTCMGFDQLLHELGAKALEDTAEAYRYKNTKE